LNLLNILSIAAETALFIQNQVKILSISSSTGDANASDDG